MSRQPKISFNIDDDLLREIKLIGVSLSHPSMSKTIQYLLEKAVYLEKENVMASSTQLFLKEELNKLSQTLSEQITYAMEEGNSSAIERIEDSIAKSNRIALASLIATTLAVSTNDDEANEIREEVLQAAYKIEG